MAFLDENGLEKLIKNLIEKFDKRYDNRYILRSNGSGGNDNGIQLASLSNDLNNDSNTPNSDIIVDES